MTPYISLITILALFTPYATAAEFSDVSSHHIHAEAIGYVRTAGIVNGYADGTFKPDAVINRAEFTKLVVEATIGKGSSVGCFSDVADQWFAPYVCTAKEKGIIGGYPDGTFGPTKSISFVEAAKIIVNAFDLDQQQASGAWYTPFVTSLEGVSAIPLDITELSQPVTRGQIAEIIFRVHSQNISLPSKFFIGSAQSHSSTSSKTLSSAAPTTSVHALPYTLSISDSWEKDWMLVPIEGTEEAMENISVETETETMFSSFFRIMFPKGSGSRPVWKFYQKPLGGFATWANPTIEPQSDIYVQYYVRFPKDFNFHKGGSLPGVFTGIQNNRTEESAAFLQFAWTAGGTVMAIGNFTDDILNAYNALETDGKLVADGSWHRLTMHLRLNTHPSKSNGLIELYQDGEIITSANHVLFPSRTDDKWDGLILASMFGGMDPSSITPQDQYVDLAGFTISNKPIGE